MQALFCQVPVSHVLNMYDVSNIWQVPLIMEAQGAHHSICKILQLPGSERMSLQHWKLSLADKWDNMAQEVQVLFPALHVLVQAHGCRGLGPQILPRLSSCFTSHQAFLTVGIDGPRVCSCASLRA